MTQVRLSTLGGVRCFLDEQELVDLPNQRIRCALLVYLAVEREVKREAIQNLFWSDRDEEKGRAALKQTIYELRRLLGDDCIDSQGDRLKVAGHVTTDLNEFQRAADAKEWAFVLSLYHGAFLQHFALPHCKPFEFWIDQQRAHAARLHRMARRAHIADLIAAKDSSTALAVARRWVELEPLEDEAQHRLIELLAASGERAEALRQADNYERLLDEDGLQPLEETKQLLERIRTGAAIALATSRSPTANTIGAADIDSRLADALPGQSAARPRWTTNRRLIIAAAAVFVIGGLWWTWVVAAGSGSRARDIRALAVLPCENLSANKEATEYQSDGLTEELANALSQIGVLRVSARTSSLPSRASSAMSGTLDANLMWMPLWNAAGG
jgi:DNA-binding SARP family transcriptional activator